MPELTSEEAKRIREAMAKDPSLSLDDAIDAFLSLKAERASAPTTSVATAPAPFPVPRPAPSMGVSQDELSAVRREERTPQRPVEPGAEDGLWKWTKARASEAAAAVPKVTAAVPGAIRQAPSTLLSAMAGLGAGAGQMAERAAPTLGLDKTSAFVQAAQELQRMPAKIEAKGAGMDPRVARRVQQTVQAQPAGFRKILEMRPEEAPRAALKEMQEEYAGGQGSALRSGLHQLLGPVMGAPGVATAALGKEQIAQELRDTAAEQLNQERDPAKRAALDRETQGGPFTPEDYMRAIYKAGELAGVMRVFPAAMAALPARAHLPVTAGLTADMGLAAKEQAQEIGERLGSYEGPFRSAEYATDVLGNLAFTGQTGVHAYRGPQGRRAVDARPVEEAAPAKEPAPEQPVAPPVVPEVAAEAPVGRAGMRQKIESARAKRAKEAEQPKAEEVQPAPEQAAPAPAPEYDPLSAPAAPARPEPQAAKVSTEGPNLTEAKPYGPAPEAPPVQSAPLPIAPAEPPPRVEAPAPRPEAAVERLVTASSPRRELPVYKETDVDPTTLKIDAKTYQYKMGGDERGQTGVLAHLQPGDWRPEASGFIIVHERADGTRYVADGHQRVGFAQREAEATGRIPRMNAFVLREADGWSARDARLTAAQANILQDRGTAVDAAMLFKANPDVNVSELLRLNRRTAKLGASIAKLNDEAIGMVARGELDPVHAGIIGDLVPDAETQTRVIRAFQRFSPANATEAMSLVSDIKRNLGNVPDEAQGSLFANDAEAMALKAHLEARSKIVAAAARDQRATARLMGTLGKNQGKIESVGNKLVADRNKEAETDARVLAERITKATSFGDASTALDNAASDLRSGQSIRAAVDRFLTEAGDSLRRSPTAEPAPVDPRSDTRPAVPEVEPEARVEPDKAQAGLFSAPPETVQEAPPARSYAPEPASAPAEVAPLPAKKGRGAGKAPSKRLVLGNVEVLPPSEVAATKVSAAAKEWRIPDEGVQRDIATRANELGERAKPYQREILRLADLKGEEKIRTAVEQPEIRHDENVAAPEGVEAKPISPEEEAQRAASRMVNNLYDVRQILAGKKAPGKEKALPEEAVEKLDAYEHDFEIVRDYVESQKAAPAKAKPLSAGEVNEGVVSLIDRLTEEIVVPRSKEADVSWSNQAERQVLALRDGIAASDAPEATKQRARQMLEEFGREKLDMTFDLPPEQVAEIEAVRQELRAEREAPPEASATEPAVELTGKETNLAGIFAKAKAEKAAKVEGFKASLSKKRKGAKLTQPENAPGDEPGFKKTTSGTPSDLSPQEDAARALRKARAAARKQARDEAQQEIFVDDAEAIAAGEEPIRPQGERKPLTPEQREGMRRSKLRSEGFDVLGTVQKPRLIDSGPEIDNFYRIQDRETGEVYRVSERGLDTFLRTKNRETFVDEAIAKDLRIEEDVLAPMGATQMLMPALFRSGFVSDRLFALVHGPLRFSGMKAEDARGAFQKLHDSILDSLSRPAYEELEEFRRWYHALEGTPEELSLDLLSPEARRGRDRLYREVFDPLADILGLDESQRIKNYMSQIYRDKVPDVLAEDVAGEGVEVPGRGPLRESGYDPTKKRVRDPDAEGLLTDQKEIGRIYIRTVFDRVYVKPTFERVKTVLSLLDKDSSLPLEIRGELHDLLGYDTNKVREYKKANPEILDMARGLKAWLYASLVGSGTVALASAAGGGPKAKLAALFSPLSNALSTIVNTTQNTLGASIIGTKAFAMGAKEFLTNRAAALELAERIGVLKHSYLEDVAMELHKARNESLAERNTMAARFARGMDTYSRHAGAVFQMVEAQMRTTVGVGSYLYTKAVQAAHRGPMRELLIDKFDIAKYPRGWQEFLIDKAKAGDWEGFARMKAVFDTDMSLFAYEAANQSAAARWFRQKAPAVAPLATMFITYPTNLVFGYLRSQVGRPSKALREVARGEPLTPEAYAEEVNGLVRDFVTYRGWKPAKAVGYVAGSLALTAWAFQQVGIDLWDRINPFDPNNLVNQPPAVRAVSELIGASKTAWRDDKTWKDAVKQLGGAMEGAAWTLFPSSSAVRKAVKVWQDKNAADPEDRKGMPKPPLLESISTPPKSRKAAGFYEKREAEDALYQKFDEAKLRRAGIVGDETVGRPFPVRDRRTGRVLLRDDWWNVYVKSIGGKTTDENLKDAAINFMRQQNREIKEALKEE